MRLVLRSSYTHVAVACFFAFCLCSSFIPNYIVITITNCLLFTSSVAVALGYTPIAIKAIREGDSSATIALGICYAWGFDAIWRMISLFWLTAGQNPILVNNDVVALMQAGMALGAMHHLTTVRRTAEGRRLVWVRWGDIWVVVGSALALAAVLLLVHPDNRWVVPLIAPYIPR